MTCSGLARNVRLEAEIAAELAEAAEESRATGRPARRLRDFMWTTLDSWSRRRQASGKAECTQGSANPRFIVTSLTPKAAEARYLYETVYCARGEMENRIKSLAKAGGMPARPLRRPNPSTPCAPTSCACGAPLADVLICALRRIGLADTRFAAATCGAIRLALFKIGALARGALNCRLTRSSGYRAAALLIVVRTVLRRTTPCRPIIRISRAAEQRPATLHTASGLVGQPLCGFR